MKIKITILLVILCALNSRVSGIDYFKYYLNTSKAELCLLDSNFNEALNYYEIAFSYAKIPWATDYHNACIASIFCSKFDKTFEYLDCLLQKGLREDYFLKYYNELLDKQIRWELFKRDLSLNIETTLKVKRLDIQHELNSRVEKDQYLAKNLDQGLEYLDSYYSTIIDNMRYLIDIEKRFGMPNENLMGINNLQGLSFDMVIIVHFINVQNLCKYCADEVPQVYKRKPERFNIKYSYCSNNEIINYPLISMLQKNVRTGEFPVLGLMNTYMWFMNSSNVPQFYSKFSKEGQFEWIFSEEKDRILMDYYKKIENELSGASDNLKEIFIFKWNKFEYPENFINYLERYNL